MRIKLIKKPSAKEAEWFDVSNFEVGKIYDVGLRLAEYLIVCGFARDADEGPVEIAADRTPPIKPR